MNKYQKAIEVIDTLLHLMCGEEREDGYKPTMEEMSNSMDLLKELVDKVDSFEWIPFTFDEEGVLNCELPDIDEDILVWDMDGTFGFGLLSHRFYAQKNCVSYDITIDKFKAIQQRIKELGWI